MRRSVQFAIFGVGFFSLVLLLNYFIFWSITDLLSYPRNWRFWIVVIVSSLIFPLIFGIDFLVNSHLMYAFSYAGYLWLGIIMELIFPLLAYDIIKLFYPVDGHLAALIIFVLIAAVTIYSTLAWFYIRRKKIELHSSRLNRDLRIVQVSDLHLGSTHGVGYLKKVINSINSLNPDVVLITGDLSDDAQFYAKGKIELFNLLKAPVYFSYGNHEVYTDVDFHAFTKYTHVKVLRNEVLDIGDYQVIGIDDGFTAQDVAKLLAGLKYDRSKYTILMCHRPVGLEEAAKEGIDLMLSGHTHNGQFFPFNFLVGAVWKRSHGIYRSGTAILYVSPGTGTWGPPLRFGSFNEVTLFILKRVQIRIQI